MNKLHTFKNSTLEIPEARCNLSLSKSTYFKFYLDFCGLAISSVTTRWSLSRGNNSVCLSQSLKNHGRLDRYSSHTTHLINFKWNQQGKLGLEILTQMPCTKKKQEIQLFSVNSNTAKIHTVRTNGKDALMSAGTRFPFCPPCFCQSCIFCYLRNKALYFFWRTPESLHLWLTVCRAFYLLQANEFPFLSPEPWFTLHYSKHMLCAACSDTHSFGHSVASQGITRRWPCTCSDLSLLRSTPGAHFFTGNPCFTWKCKEGGQETDMVQSGNSFKCGSRLVSSDILRLPFSKSAAFQTLNFTGHQCKGQSVSAWTASRCPKALLIYWRVCSASFAFLCSSHTLRSQQLLKWFKSLYVEGDSLASHLHRIAKVALVSSSMAQSICQQKSQQWVKATAQKLDTGSF